MASLFTTFRIFTFLCAAMLAAARADVIIAEFDAINIGSAADVDGNASDWIELRNSGSAGVSLNGWALSDDPGIPGKWVFPNVSMGGLAQLRVFASAKNRSIASVELHTNFKLGETGTIVLSQPDGASGWTVVSTIANYPKQRAGLSFGRAGSAVAGALGYFETPTSNAVNGDTVVTDFVADTAFTPDRGFFDAPFVATITSATPGARIIYTTDGSLPTLGNGTQVPSPDAVTPPTATINVNGTTLIRSRATKAGLGMTNVDTLTYIFPAQVLAQSGPPATALPWGNPGPDWEMDPEVVNHADVNNRCVADDLKTLPVVSVVMAWADLFGGSTAIYPPAAGVPSDTVERSASFEILNPAGSKASPNLLPGTQENGTVEITGGTSPNRWSTHKLSMKFNFSEDLNFNVFGDKGTDRFNQLILDGRYNNVWTYGGGVTPEAQRLRSDFYGDAFLADLQNAMGGTAPNSRAVHLFLNGLYWGMYILHERPDENFTTAYLGGDADDWDVIKHNLHVGGALANLPNLDSLVAGLRLDPTLPVSLTNHTAAINYQSLLNLANADLSVQANYNALLEKLDVKSLVDYVLINFYFGNTDWSHQNWYASCNRVVPGSKWRYHSWDAEHIMEAISTNVTGSNNPEGPTRLHQQLKLHAEYRLFFADAVHRHFFNGGLLTSPRVWNEFDARMQPFSEALRAESARWGDNRAHLRAAPFTNVPYLRGVEWFNQRAFWQNTYFPGRSNNTGTIGNGSVLAMLKAQNVYPAVSAPVFSQHGGSVPANFSLVMTNPGGTGTIYFMQDGSDPRIAFTSAIRAGATAYSAAVTLPSSRTIRSRVLNGATWSALNEAYFSVGTVAASAGNLVISKIHYRPAVASAAESAAGFGDRGDFEFVEVLNVSSNLVSLDGISFSAGLDVTATPGGVRELAPGGRALYVAKLAAFQFRYGNALPIAGEFIRGSSLDNDGEQLTVVGANAAVITQVLYDDNAPWPASPDGSGPSLVLMKPGSSMPTAGSNWRASTAGNGSPGVDDRLQFAAWQAANFTAGDPLAQPFEDPDADGLTNLYEFFRGTPPKVPSARNATPLITVRQFNLQDYAVFSFRRVKAAEEVLFFPEVSPDYTTWSGAGLVLFGDPVDHGDGTESRSYRTAQPVGADPHRGGFRLRLELP